MRQQGRQKVQAGRVYEAIIAALRAPGYNNTLGISQPAIAAETGFNTAYNGEAAQFGKAWSDAQALLLKAGMLSLSCIRGTGRYRIPETSLALIRQGRKARQGRRKLDMAVDEANVIARTATSPRERETASWRAKQLERQEQMTSIVTRRGNINKRRFAAIKDLPATTRPERPPLPKPKRAVG